MSTFFQQTVQAMIAKHIDRFPLLKLDQVIDWQPIEQYLNRQRTRYLRDHRGRPAYPLLSMFKAVLLGQWHSLSDPELEHSLITRIDFNLFCRFDELSIPDYSTLCRYRNWLAQDNTLSELLELINRQLIEKGLKVEKASAAVIDATIIQTAGSKQRQAIEVDEEGQVSGQTTPSKDKDARWTKKNGLYKLGYKQHTRTDSEIAFRRYFRIKCGRFTTSFLAASEQIVQPFGDGRVGEDLVFDVGGGDAVIDRHFEQVDNLVRFGAEQGYTENFAAVRVHHGFEQAVGLVEDFGFRNRVGFQFQYFHLAPRLLRGGFG